MSKPVANREVVVEFTLAKGEEISTFDVGHGRRSFVPRVGEVFESVASAANVPRCFNLTVKDGPFSHETITIVHAASNHLFEMHITECAVDYTEILVISMKLVVLTKAVLKVHSVGIFIIHLIAVELTAIEIHVHGALESEDIRCEVVTGECNKVAEKHAFECISSPKGGNEVGLVECRSLERAPLESRCIELNSPHLNLTEPCALECAIPESHRSVEIAPASVPLVKVVAAL